MRQLLFSVSELGDMDYTLPMPMSNFQMGETRVCRSITIQEDTIAEVTETFTVTLTGDLDVVVSNDARMATVSIEDNDGKSVHNSYNIVVFPIYVQSPQPDDTYTLGIHFVQQLKE